MIFEAWIFCSDAQCASIYFHSARNSGLNWNVQENVSQRESRSNRLSDDKSTMIGKSLVQIQTQNYAPKRHANLVPVAPRSMCHRGGIVNLWQTWSAAPTHCWTVTWLGWGLRYLWRVHLTYVCIKPACVAGHLYMKSISFYCSFSVLNKTKILHVQSF